MTGTYTKVEIEAPSSAVAGETVPVTIKITNIGAYQFAVYVESYFDSEWFFESADRYIYPGETLSFSSSFTMPNRNVTIHAYSCYEAEDGYWYRDDEATKGVLLPEAAVPGEGVQLKADGNFVVYTGKAQSAADAFASIMSYLAPESVVYYWNNATWLYEQVITATLMVPYGVYWIEVTQDCTWTYGADETPPSSVQLRGSPYYDSSYHGVNVVAYAGPAQSLADAFASIDPYLIDRYTFDNVSKSWVRLPDPIPSNIMAVVTVNQDCVWSFVAPELYIDGELVEALVWWEGKDGWNTILASNTWPADTETTMCFTVRNTGTKAAFFKVTFMGLESAGVLLNPGEEATLYLYPVTPSAGSYDYTLDVIADSQIVDEYPIEVTTTGVPEPEFRGFAVSEYQKV